MKKEIYIALFTILGLLVHFLILISVETWYIGRTFQDFSGITYRMIGSTWLTLGVLSGFLQGRFFWQKIYVEKVRKETVFKWFSKKR
jgi:hypothetical protein